MSDHTEKAMAIVEQHGLSHFQKATRDELREALGYVNAELRELQEKMKELKTQRHLLEMLLYVMYPDETIHDARLGYYHGASHMIAIRLSQIRGDRGASKARANCCVEGCMLDVMAKGFCEAHYHENKREHLSAPLKTNNEDLDQIAEAREKKMIKEVPRPKS